MPLPIKHTRKRLVMQNLILINGSQHDQTQSAPLWADCGVQFSNPAFTPWGIVSPTTPIKQAVATAWGKVQEEWQRCRATGNVPSGVMLGGYPPLIIPIASYIMAQGLPPLVLVAVMGPAPSVEGERRRFILQGWRALPPQGIILGEGNPLPPKPNYRWGAMIHCSARPLAGERMMDLENHTTADVINPCPPALPPAPGVDLDAYEEGCREFVETAVRSKVGQILFDGPPAETAIRVALLARSVGVACYFVRTGAPVPGSIPPIVGIEKMITY